MKDKRTFTIVLCLCWYLFSICIGNYARVDIFGVINRIPIFIIGIYLGFKIQQEEIIIDRNSNILLVVLLVLGILLGYLTNVKGLVILVRDSNLIIPNLLIVLSLPVLLSEVFELTGNKILNRVFNWYGTISLELYCAQEIIMKFNNSINLNVIVKNILSFVIVTILGYVLYLINKYIWRIIDKKITKTSYNE